MNGAESLGELREIDADLAIDEVIVFEDRAQVIRRGRVTLPHGKTTLVVRSVAPVSSDRTITAAVRGGSATARVTDTLTRREMRPVAEREQEPGGEIERLLRQAESKHQDLERRAQLLAQQQALVEQMTEQALADLVTDVAWDNLEPQAWQSVLSELDARERALRDEVLSVSDQRQELKQELSDLRKQLEATRRPDLILAADLLTELEVTTAGEAELELSYVVPVACWRPQHTARLLADSEGKPRVTFASDACVWQCTGEDWTDAQLYFSTQRPSLGFEPPLLGEDTLVAREKPDEMVVEVREQEVRTTGLGAAQKISDQLPGVDDGGTPLTMRSAARASIPSDGRPYRVAISEFEDHANHELVLVPELAKAVINRVTLSNRGSHPILAGPVDLIADNGLVGRSPVLFIAPDERLALGFGPDPAVRVSRKAEQVNSKVGALARHVRTDHTVTLLLSNISRQDKSFTLTERIPVSEVEEVEVSFDSEASSSGAKLDSNGFVTWQIVLPAGGHQTIRLRYTVRKRKKVQEA
jgi:uncharacterized protein (TIGR02231 family)